MRPSTPRVQRGVTGTLTAIAVACTGGVADRVFRGSPCAGVPTVPAAEPTRAEPAGAGPPPAPAASSPSGSTHCRPLLMVPLLSGGGDTNPGEQHEPPWPVSPVAPHSR